MRLIRFSALPALFAMVSCGPPPDPLVPPPPDPPAASTAPVTTPQAPAAQAKTEPSPQLDPVAVGLTVDGVKKLCDEHLAEAQRLIDQIKTLKGAPPEKLIYQATLGRFDDAIFQVDSATAFPQLMEEAHPDAAVRAAAQLCAPKSSKLMTAIWLDADLAGVINAYAAKGEKLTGEKQRLLNDVLRDFRRNGLDLPPDKQQRLRGINDELTKISQEFMANLKADSPSIEVLPGSLKGLSKEYIAKHPPKANGKIDIGTKNDEYFPFLTYSKDRKAALRLYIASTNRGGEANVKLLDRLITLRHEKAKMLGYARWADYAIEPRMAKTTKNVRDFLEKVGAALKKPASVELQELMDEHVRLGGKKTDKLLPPDRYFLEDRVREAKYKFNSQALSDYLEIQAVKKGLLDITARMYGLEYKEVASKTWHPDVTAHEVWSGGKKIGKFYLDLYPRPNKFQHLAMFPITSAKRHADGNYQLPAATLECNFPKPGAQPALMSHEEVVNFFHEFGHVLHHLLTRSELASYSGTNTVRDFVEAPSQMFEEWAWSREVLDLFAKHHKTGAPIPDDLFQAMQKARTFGRALFNQRQLFLATLDLEYHAREPGFDSTKVLQEVQSSIDSFGYVPGTHFQSSFGHLINYDAGYYGYQWALALSRDVLTRFRKEGLLNPAVAASWRDEVLAKGGGEEEATMIARFLGRPLSYDAYFAYLSGKEP